MSSLASLYTGWIESCKYKRWDQLEANMDHPYVDIDMKILAKATFDTYHRERNNELSIFTAQLETRFGPGSTRNGLVHLGDFTNAYLLAKAGAEDDRIAEKISEYVRNNAPVLGLMLVSENIEPSLKTRSIKCFPFLVDLVETLKVSTE